MAQTLTLKPIIRNHDQDFSNFKLKLKQFSLLIMKDITEVLREYN